MTRKYPIEQFEDKIGDFLDLMLDGIDIDIDYEFREGASTYPDIENPDIVVTFSGPEADLLLQNKAELLLALEHLTMEMLRLPHEDHSLIVFDANDYRLLRIEELRLAAQTACAKVKESLQPFFFPPMTSRERRIIHMTMRPETEIRSESVGVGGGRQVVFVPAGMATPVPPVAPSRDRRGPGGGGGRPGGGGGRPGGGEDGRVVVEDGRVAVVDDRVADTAAGDPLAASDDRAVIVDRAQAVAARGVALVVDTVGRAGMAAVELVAVVTPATLAVAAATTVVAAPATTTAAIAS